MSKEYLFGRLFRRLWFKRGHPKQEGRVLKCGGRPVARVIGWARVADPKRVIVSARPITDEKQVPKRTKWVWITLFDPEGRPSQDLTIGREKLKEYYLVG